LIAAIDGCLQSAVGRHQGDGRREGILYSGGTASSLLLAAAPRPAGRVVTVAVEHDPTELARSHGAAAYLGCERELEAAMAPLPILASALVEHVEEPIADPSAIVEFAILAAARRHTDCAIAAHGASILWSGCARRPVRPVWSSLHRHAIYTRSFGWQVRDANPLARHHELYAARETDDRLARAMYVDARTLLPDGALAAAGRAARAAGMQLRYPFLDRALVQLAVDTPPALRNRGPIGMSALRRLLQQKLPAALLPPVRQRTAHLWLRSALAALVPSMLFAPRFDTRGIVSRPAVVRLWDEYRGGRRDHAQRLWSLLMLELWFREFIDGDRAEQPLEYAVVKIA
jgi:asparagine synthase (glutamine-hydrolysing)